jgi:MoxR-like ATPase
MATEFRGTDRYIATEELMAAVNAAMVLSRPLLIKGEPGTGKTLLANEIARSLNKPFYEWHIKSTTKAQQGLYEYDAVSRLRDSQLGDPRVKDIHNYIVKGDMWEAFDCDVQPVLLIDEIDKADIEFPNDLLRELDRMEFYVYARNRARQTSAGHRDHQQQRKGAARRLSAALLFPLHPFSGYGHDDANRRCAFSGLEARTAA